MFTQQSMNRQATGLVAAIRHLWQVHAPLTISGLLMAGFTVFFVVGIFADNRVITGVPAWLKPSKFGISISMYTLTLTWILGFVRGHRRIVNLVAWTAIVTFLLEMSLIVTQVVRGTTSHFNVATPFDGALFATMGIAISVLWLANFVVAALLLFQRFEDSAFAWSLRLAVLIALLGMALGFLMTNPTAQQMASWGAGAPVTIVGAHSVGVEDGGPGLPLTGWSTVGGDLRIPHFFGMHALQLLPFVGWLATRRRKWNTRQRTGLVWVAALGYLGLIGLLTLQALRGQSIVHPDALTAALFAGLVGSVAMGAAAALKLGVARGAAVLPPSLEGERLR